MSVISSIQSGLGRAATGVRTAVTRSVRSEIEGFQNALQDTGAVESRARQITNLARAAAVTWLNTTGVGRLLTNKYTRTALTFGLAIGLFLTSYLVLIIVGFSTVTSQDAVKAIELAVNGGGCLLLSEDHLACGVELSTELADIGKTTLLDFLSGQACVQGAERMGTTYDCQQI